MRCPKCFGTYKEMREFEIALLFRFEVIYLSLSIFKSKSKRSFTPRQRNVELK